MVDKYSGYTDLQRHEQEGKDYRICFREGNSGVLVIAPHGDYVFCVITKNQGDQRWVRDNAGYALLRSVSKTLWQYFEPESEWKPAQGLEEWDY